MSHFKRFWEDQPVRCLVNQRFPLAPRFQFITGGDNTGMHSFDVKPKEAIEEEAAQALAADLFEEELLALPESQLIKLVEVARQEEQEIIDARLKQKETDRFYNAISDVIKAAKSFGKAAGILAPVKADADRYIGNGCTLVAVGADLGLVARGSDALMATYRIGAQDT